MKTKPAAAARFQHQQRVACATLGVIAWAAVVAAHAATPSRISEVTLYPDSATIVRSVTVAPGTRSVELTCLPSTFDSQSLRVEGDNAVRVGDIRTESMPREGAPGCSMTTLDTQIRALEDQRTAVDTQMRANDLSANYLKVISERTTADGRTPATDFSTLGKSTDALTRTAQEVFARQEQLKRRDAELKSQLDALRLTRGSGSGATIRTIRIAVAAPHGGELRISYQTPNAGWRPAYQANLDSARSNVVIERQATIAQATGEDWRGVRLRLSTGQPRGAQRGPEPFTWRLDIVQPQPAAPRPYPVMAAPVAAPSPSAPMLKLGRNNAEESGPLFDVSTVETSYTTEFEVPGTVELPSDAQKATFSLATQALPATLTARSAPRLDSTAYLIAMVDRPDGTWPAGQMQLRRDGATVGSTYWNPTGEDQRLTLPFGRDDLLSITADTPKTFNRSVGLLDNRNERQYTSLYTVRNRHRDPISIEILESMPVSQAEDIKVRATFSPEPAQREWENRPGIVAWQQTLKPGDSARFSADYLITYPKDARITGLR